MKYAKEIIIGILQVLLFALVYEIGWRIFQKFYIIQPNVGWGIFIHYAFYTFIGATSLSVILRIIFNRKNLVTVVVFLIYFIMILVDIKFTYVPYRSMFLICVVVFSIILPIITTNYVFNKLANNSSKDDSPEMD